MDSIGIVCICNNEDMLYSLEDRFRSRFMPVRIHFPPYSRNELTKILIRREEAALRDDAWDMELLRETASLANVNARLLSAP